MSRSHVGVLQGRPGSGLRRECQGASGSHVRVAWEWSASKLEMPGSAKGAVWDWCGRSVGGLELALGLLWEWSGRVCVVAMAWEAWEACVALLKML